MKTTIINLTPHTIHLTSGRVIAASGNVARVTSTRQHVADLDGIPIYAAVLGAVHGLPEPQDDTVLIVSGMVRSHPDVAHRMDVLSPGEPVRDFTGTVIGCDGLNGNH